MNTNKIDLIKAEVERLKLYTMDEHMKFYSECAEAEYNALCKVEEIIDSLQEEPTQVNNDSDISCNCSLCSMHLTCKYYNPNKDNNVEHCIGGTPLQLIKVKKKEPTTSVWHDANETPTDKSKVIVWLGEELNEIVQCHYKYGKFVEKIPTEEYGRYALVGNAIEGYSRQFVSNKKRADLTELVVKWAYKDDLIKL